MIIGVNMITGININTWKAQISCISTKFMGRMLEHKSSPFNCSSSPHTGNGIPFKTLLSKTFMGI